MDRTSWKRHTVISEAQRNTRWRCLRITRLRPRRTGGSEARAAATTCLPALPRTCPGTATSTRPGRPCPWTRATTRTTHRGRLCRDTGRLTVSTYCGSHLSLSAQPNSISCRLSFVDKIGQSYVLEKKPQVIWMTTCQKSKQMTERRKHDCSCMPVHYFAVPNPCNEKRGYAGESRGTLPASAGADPPSGAYQK